METLKVVLPALIALIGTIVVAIFGYRQWKRQHILTRVSGVLNEKQNAYKTIWSKLEEVHLFIRSEKFRRKQYLELVRNVNIEMMQSGLLLERGEARIVNEYLQTLEALAKTLAHQEASSVRKNVKETLYTTGPLPMDVFNKVEDLRKANDDVEEKREILIKRFRHAIGADLL